MLARLRKTHEENERGFTLIELLVVMIIIGILAAIAVPVFLSQRAKARDSATKSDVSNAGKEIASYYVDGQASLQGTIDTTAKTLAISTIAVGSVASVPVATVKLSDGTVGPATGNAVVNLTIPAANPNNCSVGNSWYVTLRNTAGSQGQYFYSAQSGLTTSAPTACA